MFDKLVHSDWSNAPSKRWMAQAKYENGKWHVSCPVLVTSPTDFLSDLLSHSHSTLAGFDFPIGLPRSFGAQSGLSGFRAALTVLGVGKWDQFYNPAIRPDEISIHRPFYPQKSVAGSRQNHLFEALGFGTFDDLRRECERKTEGRRAACPIFWTLGANQVGKAAIDGWRTIVQPATARGARLWPFDGTLNELSGSGCVLCETYPQEAYAHIGLKLKSKRRQSDRKGAATAIVEWALRNSVVVTEEAKNNLMDGFGAAESGEDPFDALIGLLSMIEVVDGRRHEGFHNDESLKVWEGWILGQKPSMPVAQC